MTIRRFAAAAALSIAAFAGAASACEVTIDLKNHTGKAIEIRGLQTQAEGKSRWLKKSTASVTIFAHSGTTRSTPKFKTHRKASTKFKVRVRYVVEKKRKGRGANERIIWRAGKNTSPASAYATCGEGHAITITN